MDCFAKLIGIQGTCAPASPAPYFWLHDMPGADLTRLAQLAEGQALTGEDMGAQLIESAARIMVTDVESLYAAAYKVTNNLVAGESLCTFNANSLSGSGLGVLVKDQTTSTISNLVIDRLLVRIMATGTYSITITDGITPKVITTDFVSGEDVNVFNSNGSPLYTTSLKQVQIYSNAPLAQLACPPSGSGCGCSGRSAVVSNLLFKGLNNGAEAQAAYGFIPYARVTCDASALLCRMASTAPRILGLALLYKVGELYYQQMVKSLRINQVASGDPDPNQKEVSRYAKLYNDRVNGAGTSGVRAVVNNLLSTSGDQCVICDNPLQTAWATG